MKRLGNLSVLILITAPLARGESVEPDDPRRQRAPPRAREVLCAEAEWTRAHLELDLETIQRRRVPSGLTTPRYHATPHSTTRERMDRPCQPT